MDSLGKMLGILDLVTVGRPQISASEVAAALGCSRTTSYRYLGSLADAGLLSPRSGGGFVLGPRIIELDRQIRLSDPLLAVAEPRMHELSEAVDVNMFLTAHYRQATICIAQSWIHEAQPTSYSRGAPMQLLRGAAGKVILANLPTDRRRAMMLEHPAEVAAAGLGESWTEMQANLKRIRRQGYAYTHAEVDPISAGLATALIDQDGKVLGSLVMAVPLTDLNTHGIKHYVTPLLETTAAINAELADQDSQGASG